MLKRVKKKSKEEAFRLLMNKRVSLILAVVVILFSVLIMRLGYLQIVKGGEYKRTIDSTESITVNESVPRGRIYDRNGKVLVDNESKKAITYTRDRRTSQDDILEIAEKLSHLMKMDTSNITDRDKQDFWILRNQDEVQKLMKDEQALFSDGNISQEEYDEALYNKVTSKYTNTLSKEDLQILAIFREMNGGSQLSPVVIKNEGVKNDEYAAVSQHLSELPGVNTTMDWERRYPYGETLRTLFGNVSSKEEGLPKELVDDYLAKGYSRNDRVGKSYLEYQYEDILKGSKKKMKYVTDKSGKITSSEVISEGSRGNDLVLTIDIELQKKVEEYVDKHIESLRSEGAKDMDRVMVVVQDPRNGDVLAMAGRDIDENGEITDNHIGNFTSQYTVGSSVKGATLLTGYQNGVLDVGDKMVDEPLKFNGGLTKRSYFNQDGKKTITDAEALMHSSNVFMYKTALLLADSPYRSGMSLPTDVEQAGIKLRKGLNQVGLGVKTGIDLPNESAGQIEPIKDNPGNYIDLAIGQFDTYTPIQLSQYAATIANDGYRLKPHLAKEIRNSTNEDSLGPIKKSFKGEVMNKVNNSDKEIKQVQKGFDMAFNEEEGTGYSSFNDTVVRSAGKTGTAEVFKDGKPKVNSTYVGYAPTKNPELSFSITYTNQPVPEPWLPGGDLGRDIINYYFKDKK
ncbi:penicillin-binding protein 2 [Mammaliicoccus sp. P-M57]|uniref:peptidoglycan D,D-transpeptidase FtsI family protein n=1 Tax=Mammaliicoccus sp. P-M57 TaxID=2898716 RepID=UPI001EFAE074|nr:penicillin-binding protein 2 [Mammaliicoccus sp. P-M57]